MLGGHRKVAVTLGSASNDRGRGDPGADVDGACQRAGQHDLACGEPLAVACQRAHEPRDGRGGMAEHRRAAALDHSSPTDSVIRRPGRSIPSGERGSPITATADDALSAIVSGSRMRQSAMRLSMTSSAGATDAVAASTSSADTPSPSIASPRMNATSPSTRGAISLETSNRRSAVHDHRREQVAVVGLVDAELPLDRLARQPDLVARDPPPGGDPQGTSRPLHGVGVVDREIAELARERLDRRGRDVRPQQAAGEPLGVDGGRRAHVATVKNDSGNAAPYQTIARAMSSPFQITGCQSGPWIA